MKLDGNAVLYQLKREFEDVTCSTPLRSLMVDYPVLYDETIDMSGHVVLLSGHERPRYHEHMNQVLCVCLDDKLAREAEEKGLCVIRVHDAVSFQHLYNRMQSVFVANERLEAQLRAYVDTYAGYQPLLDACAQAMGPACVLIDDQYRTVCYSRTSDEGGDAVIGPRRKKGGDAFDSAVLEESAIDLFMASQKYRYMRTRRRVFSMPGTDNVFFRNIFHEDNLVGMLAMKHRGESVSARYVRFLLNYLAPFVEGMYAHIGSLDPLTARPTRIRAALKTVLRGALENTPLLTSLLIGEGNDIHDSYMIMRIERSFTNEGSEALSYFAQRFERSLPHAYCAEDDGNLYALVNVGAALSEEGPLSATAREFMAKIPAILRDKLVKAGASRPFSDMNQLPTARVQADAALEQGEETDPFSWYYRFDDYALDWLLRHGCSNVSPERICHEAIVKLERYDEAHGTSLLDTLAAFMSCRYNATLAAQRLFVARSTLINRLERVVELTGLNFDSLEERTYLGASLILMDHLRQPSANAASVFAARS